MPGNSNAASLREVRKIVAVFEITVFGLFQFDFFLIPMSLPIPIWS